jgi:hypothetical protein
VTGTKTYLFLSDGAGASKGFNKAPRKREGALPGSSKSDQPRQRNKTYDKRPRPRGQYNADRKEDPQVIIIFFHFPRATSMWILGGLHMEIYGHPYGIHLESVCWIQQISMI